MFIKKRFSLGLEILDGKKKPSAQPHKTELLWALGSSVGALHLWSTQLVRNWGLLILYTNPSYAQLVLFSILGGPTHLRLVYYGEPRLCLLIWPSCLLLSQAVHHVQLCRANPLPSGQETCAFFLPGVSLFSRTSYSDFYCSLFPVSCPAVLALSLLLLP